MMAEYASCDHNLCSNCELLEMCCICSQLHVVQYKLVNKYIHGSDVVDTLSRDGLTEAVCSTQGRGKTEALQ